MPVVRDVCKRCNNETLSALDGYVAALDRSYFSVVAPAGVVVLFHYDYFLLLRWLLKAWYNDARTTPRNVEEHRRFVPYILGKVPNPPNPVTLFVGHLASFDTAPALGTQGLPKILRFGTTYSLNAEIAENLLLARMLSLNAYLFHLFVWKTGTGRSQRREFVRGLEAEWEFRELREHLQKVDLKESKVDTLHYLNARTTSGGTLRKRRSPTTKGRTAAESR
jgi:hypothetical protein